MQKQTKQLTTVEKRITVSKELVLEQLKKVPIVQVVCEKIGIGRATYYRWRKEDKKFAEKADAAQRKGVLLINDMAESQLLSAIKDKHMTAIIYWLKHHHKDYSTRIELSHKISSLVKLTSEQQALIDKAIILIAPKKRGEKNEY